MDLELLDSIEAAVFVVRLAPEGVLLERTSPLFRRLTGAGPVESAARAEGLLPAAWLAALGQAATAGGADLPPSPLGRAHGLRGTARRIDGEPPRVLGTVWSVAAPGIEEADILDRLSEMVCRWRPDGTIYYCNTAYARQCGLAREQVVGRSLFELTPPDELPQILANVASLGPDRPLASYDHRIPAPDGGVRWQEWIDQALLDPEGRVVGYQSTGRDITRRKLAEERLRRSEQRLQLALATSRQRVWELDLATGLGWVAPLAGEGEGDRPPPPPTLARWLRRLHPEDRPWVTAGLERLARGETASFAGEYRLRRQDGTYRWVLTHTLAIGRETAGGPPRIIGTSVDVDARHRVADQLRESEQRLRLALEAAGLAVWEVDFATGRLRADRTGAARLGLADDSGSLSALGTLRRVDPRDRAELMDRLRAHLDGRADRFRSEHRVHQPDSGARWMEVHGLVTARDPDGQAQRMLGVAADVTLRKETELRLATLALEDYLTGLPNRRALDTALARALAGAERAGERVGFLLLDLDGFKAVNDRLGHLAGDELLTETAGRLRLSVRRADFVARFGGDEFAVVASSTRTRRQLEQLARRIMTALRHPVTTSAGRAQVAVSIGIAVYPEDAATPLDLIGRADAALYAAKRRREGFCFAADLTAAELA